MITAASYMFGAIAIGMLAFRSYQSFKRNQTNILSLYFVSIAGFISLALFLLVLETLSAYYATSATLLLSLLAMVALAASCFATALLDVELLFKDYRRWLNPLAVLMVAASWGFICYGVFTGHRIVSVVNTLVVEYEQAWTMQVILPINVLIIYGALIAFFAKQAMRRTAARRRTTFLVVGFVISTVGGVGIAFAQNDFQYIAAYTAITVSYFLIYKGISIQLEHTDVEKMS